MLKYLARLVWETAERYRISLGRLAPWILGLVLDRKPRKMWWTRKSCKEEKLEEERVRTEMELALLRSDLLSWEEVKAHMDYETELRNQLYYNNKAKRELLEKIVPYLAGSGQISNDEYAKYLLDETGTYIPKLIKHT